MEHNNTWNISYENAVDLKVGGVFRHTDGKRYIVTKKAAKVLAIRRYYWFEAVLDWLIGKMGCCDAHPRR